jgi:hypothetical protein
MNRIISFKKFIKEETLDQAKKRLGLSHSRIAIAKEKQKKQTQKATPAIEVRPNLGPKPPKPEKGKTMRSLSVEPSSPRPEKGKTMRSLSVEPTAAGPAPQMRSTKPAAPPPKQKPMSISTTTVDPKPEKGKTMKKLDKTDWDDYVTKYRAMDDKSKAMVKSMMPGPFGKFLAKADSPAPSVSANDVTAATATDKPKPTPTPTPTKDYGSAGGEFNPATPLAKLMPTYPTSKVQGLSKAERDEIRKDPIAYLNQRKKERIAKRDAHPRSRAGMQRARDVRRSIATAAHRHDLGWQGAVAGQVGSFDKEMDDYMSTRDKAVSAAATATGNRLRNSGKITITQRDKLVKDITTGKKELGAIPSREVQQATEDDFEKLQNKYNETQRRKNMTATDRESEDYFKALERFKNRPKDIGGGHGMSDLDAMTAFNKIWHSRK